MPRPRLQRIIQCEPGVTYFKPRGVPLTNLTSITLTVDELESLKLVDLQLLDQTDAAKKMNISQPTLHRIVKSARTKIAEALVNGKAILIEGGTYTLSTERKFKCYACGHTWSTPYGTGRPAKCPQCEDTNIHRAPEDRGYMRGQHGCRGVRRLADPK